MVDWNPLFLVILGGLLAVLGGLLSGRITAQSARDLFNRERALREAEERERIRTHFIQELKFNRALIGRYVVGTRVTLLATEAWLNARGRTGLLGDTADKKLLETYSEIRRYNDAVSYAIREEASVTGGVQAALLESEKKTSKLLDESIQFIEDGGSGGA